MPDLALILSWIAPVVWPAGLLALGFFGSSFASRWVRRESSKRFTPAQAEVTARLVWWGGIALTALAVLRSLQVDLSILLGAAGLLTVALGFASQTSASNLISGLFLLFERPFALRDVIRVGTTTGEVVSIDLLSVRLRTFDNLLVRIPNETLLRSEIVNLSHFPVRRFDLVLELLPDQDLERAREVLVRACDAWPLVLDEPRPVMHFIGYRASGAAVQLSAWATREDFIEVRNGLAERVRRELTAAGVALAFPNAAVTAAIAASTRGATAPGLEG